SRVRSQSLFHLPRFKSLYSPLQIQLGTVSIQGSYFWRNPKEASNGNNKKLMEWLDLRKSVVIPDFYAAQETITKAETHYTSQDFWDYLEDELKKLKDEDQVKNSEPFKVAGKLKRSGIAVNQAEKFIKSSRRVADDAIKQRNETQEKWNNLLKPKDANLEGDAE
ncbi:hypothetical protein QLH52_10010, partial [Methylomonas sp. OY6]